ncbi:MAG: hypothetical protein AB1489_14430 [Acidobacteriota bacterium]
MMKKYYWLSIIPLIICFTMGYRRAIDIDKDKAEIMRLQELQRKAHFNKDAGLLVSMFSDDYINVKAGKIESPTREQSINRLQPYFDQSSFIEWDNISPPIIRVSEDASMAYAIVQKRVRLKAKDNNGVEREYQTIFAWMETYEKREGKWKLTAVASTNEPSQE